MKKESKFFKITAVITLVLILLFTISAIKVSFSILPSIQNAYFIWKAYVDLDVQDKIIDDWKTKPTEFLLKMLKSKVHMYSSSAYKILLDKKEKKAMPVFLELTQSKDDQTKTSAYVALARLGNNDIKELFMGKITQKELHKDYVDILRALSIMRHEPALPYIIKLAQSKEGDPLYEDRSYAINMIERYGKKELLPILEKIALDDPNKHIRWKAEDSIKKMNKQLLSLKSSNL